MGNETACVPAELMPEPIDLPDDFAVDPHASYDRLHALGPVHHVRFPDSSTGWLITG
ncbi:hypothetical protein [Nocardia stercoris]|uniref:hypothetical protein n=1 Tax=Nocardia stercoris TaxID=2483361 RepID=UPI001319D9A4|nr:hypothetical protein [Nocardia stercoris]